MARHGGVDPLALSRVTILLPTRRSIAALRAAFLRLSQGRAMLLPRLRPLGDVDEDELDLTAGADGATTLDIPPAIPSLTRRLLLARLVAARPDLDGNVVLATRMAEALAELLDAAATEGLSLDALANLVPESYARHWQITLDFLAIVREHWPALLAERGMIDASDRRNRLLAALAQRWQDKPPADPIYAAGSTGSIPASAALLNIIARLPQGAVVLPGLDLDIDQPIWEAIAEDPTHPQYGMQQLLLRIGVDRREVEPWDGAVSGARAKLLADAMRPASSTDAWPDLPLADGKAFAGLRRIDCAGPRDEAGTIALLLREVLERPGRTAALITPDRDLARRVAAALRRWQIDIDDSSGTPLAETPAGIFLRLTARLLGEQVAPVPLLALLKHPISMAGQTRGDFLRQTRRLEKKVLRGMRPAPGFPGLVTAIAGAIPTSAKPLLDWLSRIGEAAEPLAELMRGDASLIDLLRANLRFAEWLAVPHGDRTTALWNGDDGEALANFIADLLAAAPELGTMRGSDWPALLDTLLSGAVVRPRFGKHPRLFIWGLLEARLQQADLLVLGGLNEGSWPPDAADDPWLSRPMRTSFGLTPLERRIGQTAHDFAQAAASPEVVLVRAAKAGGTPTVPSRWLLRLDAMLERDPRWKAVTSTTHRHWQEELDRPAVEIKSKPPAPRPPVEARPRQLSATQVETWIRDPYAVYARHVLKLRVLDPLDADPGARERGTMIHKALEEFARRFPEPGSDAASQLTAIGEEIFAGLLDRPAVRAFWWPRFRRIAEWFAANELEWRAAGRRIAAVEVTGAMTLPATHAPFILKATADRIDRLPDGRLAILDYKTGMPPSDKQVLRGLNPQLPLEAMIALAGGFPGVSPADVGELIYLRLRGGDPAGEIKSVEAKDDDKNAVNVMELIKQTKAALLARINKFDDAATPYLSRPRVDWMKYAGDYDHLARLQEWSASGEASE